MKFKVAVVQFRSNMFNPEKNLEKAEKFIKNASERADIIIFPEYFLTGDVEPKLIERFEDKIGKYRKHFQKLARKYKIDIIPGSFIEKTQNGRYNTTYFIDSSGKIKARYRKVNLWLTERRHTTPGNEVCVFRTKYGKCGIVICWDLIFPEHFRKMAHRGVKIVFCPSIWYMGSNYLPYKKYNPKAEMDHVNALCLVRAVENNIVLVYANAVGKPKTCGSNFDEAIGNSQIVVPIKCVLKKLNQNTETMFIQEIDTSILEDEERAYKIRKDLKKRVL